MSFPFPVSNQSISQSTLLSSSPSLHLWSFYGLRSQVWLYRLLRAMRRYEPHLLLRREWIANRDLAEFPWPAGKIHYFRKYPAGLRVIAKLTPLLRTGRLNVLNSLDAAFVRQTLREMQARILHVHFGWLATAILSSQFDFGAPAVVSVYGSDVIRATRKRSRYRGNLRSLLRRGIPFVVESHFLKEELVEMGASSDRVFVVPVGIDLAEQPDAELIREQRLRRQESRPVRIITIGRLVDYKAPQKLPIVAKMLKDRGIDFEWNLVGEGPLLKEILSSREASGISDRFHVRGSIPFEELKSLLWNSDIMVHNAVVAPDGGRECLGVALIEAQAVGIPVVSCKVGGIPEAVVDGSTALLVKEGDMEAIADRIVHLVTNVSLRHEMAMAGMLHVRSHFDSARLARLLEATYDFLTD